MRRRLVITDVTRMAGTRVCVAGYTRKGGQPEFCVRPLFRYGDLTEQWLFARSGVIRPFAVVEFDLLKHNPGTPHSEDWHIEPRLRLVQEVLATEQRLDFLRTIEDPTVSAIFGADIHHDLGWFVKLHEGNRSLGTIRAANVIDVVYRQRSHAGKWEYRLCFRDREGEEFRLAVTDLTFRLHLDALRATGMAPARITHVVGDAIATAEHLYLRIGLARGWEEYPDRCFLQITGVYSFPDYLAGKTFADYMPEYDRRRGAPPAEDVPF